jgi:hypothetical protein
MVKPLFTHKRRPPLMALPPAPNALDILVERADVASARIAVALVTIMESGKCDDGPGCLLAQATGLMEEFATGLEEMVKHVSNKGTPCGGCEKKGK